MTKKSSVSKTVPTTPPAITEAEVQQCLAQLDSVAAVLAPYVVTLTAQQRKQQAKSPKDVDAAVPVLAALSKRFELAATSLDVDAMTQQTALASALVPLIGRVRSLSEMLSDTVLQARSNAWHTATTVHSLLVRLAKRTPSIQGELSTVKSVFTRPSRTAKAAAASPTTESEATPTTEAVAPAPAVAPPKAS